MNTRKQTIRLTESDLRNIVKGSVRQIISEANAPDDPNDIEGWNDTWNLWGQNPPPENRRIQNQFQDCEVPPRVYAKWKDMYDYAQNNPEFDGAWDEWMKSRGNKYNYGTWNESLNRIVRESINRVLRRR